MNIVRLFVLLLWQPQHVNTLIPLLFLVSRVFPSAFAKRRGLASQHVRANIRDNVCAERRTVQGLFCIPNSILRVWQHCHQPGLHVVRLLGQPPGEDVPAGQRAVRIQRLLHGVHQQAHRAAAALW